MPISDKLAAQALAKIREQEAEINELRKRLGVSGLDSAIEKSLKNPATGNGRNNGLVSGIVREGLFRGDTPVSKAARRQNEAERKRQLRRDLEKAQGIRPFRKD